MYRQITIKDAYKKHYKVGIRNKKIKYKLYSEIIYTFNKMITDKIVNEGYDFIMPYTLGNVKIRKRKKSITLDKDGNIDKNNLMIDWQHTWIRWQKKYPGLTRNEILKITREIPPNKRGYAFFYNDHSNGYNCRWYWGKNNKLHNSTCYIFRITKANRKKLAKAVLTDPSIIQKYTEFLMYMKYQKNANK